MLSTSCAFTFCHIIHKDCLVAVVQGRTSCLPKIAIKRERKKSCHCFEILVSICFLTKRKISKYDTIPSETQNMKCIRRAYFYILNIHTLYS